MKQHSAYVSQTLHCRWKRSHSIIPNHSIYDVTSTSGRTAQPIYQTSHPLYLCHHTISTDISPTFLLHHTHILCDIIWTIYNIASNTMSSHYSNYDITTFIYESTSRMRATYKLNMWYHSHYLGHHTHYIDNITPNLFMTSHSPYVWHRLHYTRHHILPFWPQTTIWGHHTHYIRDRVQCICVIAPTISMISQPICVWYHIQYMWDILSTIFITSYTLCMTSQPCVLITPHSVYVWLHLRYRRRHIHSITTSQNLYDFTSTSGMTSRPLYQTSHQRYLCHHNLSTEITPTFEWHHNHYMCDIICTIYIIISTAYVITLL